MSTLMTDAAPTEGTASQAAPDATASAAAPDATTQQAPAADSKPADAKPTEGDKDGDSQAAKPDGAPETYADFTLPDGVSLVEGIGDDIKVLAKELNLPQDKAQKLVDLAVKHTGTVAERNKAAVEALVTEWTGKTKADPEFGGDKLAENLGVAKKALEKFGSKELTALLNETGLGNHPEVVRFFVRAGKAMSEDTFVSAGGNAAKPKTITSMLYPNMN